MEESTSSESCSLEATLKLKNQLLKISSRSNDVTLSMKKIEAELEELEALDDEQKVYKQIARMFVELSVGSFRVDMKKEWQTLSEELLKLREIERELQSRLGIAQTFSS